MNSGLGDYGKQCFLSPPAVSTEADSHLIKPTGNRTERISELERPADCTFQVQALIKASLFFKLTLGPFLLAKCNTSANRILIIGHFH